MRRPQRKPRASTGESRVEQPTHTNGRNVMSIDPDWSDDDVVKGILRPIEEVLAREDEELNKVDEAIREAESKCQHMFHPEP
jgi:hypothetical protein